VLMIGRGDYYRVDAALRQQVVIVQVRLGVRRIFERGLYVRLVYFGYGHARRAQLLKIAAQIAPASARPINNGATSTNRNHYGRENPGRRRLNKHLDP